MLFFGLVQWRSGRFLAAENLRAMVTDAGLAQFLHRGGHAGYPRRRSRYLARRPDALSAGIAGRLWEQGQPLPIVAAVAVLLGGLGGAFNAALALVGRVHPIVVTLGTMSLYRGLTLWWINKTSTFRQRSQLDLCRGAWPAVDCWSGWLCSSSPACSLPGRFPGGSYMPWQQPGGGHRVGIDRGRSG